MSTHIGAEPGEIAPRVLLPGDPLRAQWIADTYLDGATEYNRVRNMLGYTGTYRGTPISVQGSGMGQPSLSIYANELFRDYDVRQIVRVGSCGALSADLDLRDIVLGMTASTDSAMNKLRFHGLDYAPAADFALLEATWRASSSRGARTVVGQLFSSDSFYPPRPELTTLLKEHGVLAIEMEASALYTLAAQYDRQALSVCTVSDHIVNGTQTSSEDRERTFSDMVEMALDAMLEVPVE
ncbi:purine-nucleoside phosphorylase [Solicola gregarius]|uniref:Uridine phosphorylase n=1 Tax=Solicola gregarius TaxID=2908642 RepID=A0AA46YMV2_9ACTN|nr:purine-nucleoside phosphorylase [Solicola gregarius]UYM06103.1 purine-nucleoside phosphorylase [Solicola gregarius]